MKLDPDNSNCRSALKKAKEFEKIKELGNNAIKEG
jgi:hypothetical protein